MHQDYILGSIYNLVMRVIKLSLADIVCKLSNVFIQWSVHFTVIKLHQLVHTGEHIAVMCVVNIEGLKLHQCAHNGEVPFLCIVFNEK
jgi:hypothetical protein